MFAFQRRLAANAGLFVVCLFKLAIDGSGNEQTSFDLKARRRRKVMGRRIHPKHNSLPFHIFRAGFLCCRQYILFRSGRKERKMDTTRLIKDLRAEERRIERAIAALEALSSDSTGSQTTRIAGANKAGRRKMSPAARKRISMMMKKRWAARRKAAKKG